MAVAAFLFAKIAEQLTATAYLVIGGIGDHGLDALLELVLPLFIDGRPQLDMLHILASLGIADIRCLLLGNEVQDMPFAQALQCHIDLMGLQGCL